mmetsp:Transcript_9990/g.42147  ORF Transcript_9990/g.42147 Transcript_9990/m.42147 type:complete len:118 (+) Transcript_9990:522-875(+)
MSIGAGRYCCPLVKRASEGRVLELAGSEEKFSGISVYAKISGSDYLIGTVGEHGRMRLSWIGDPKQVWCDLQEKMLLYVCFLFITSVLGKRRGNPMERHELAYFCRERERNDRGTGL